MHSDDPDFVRMFDVAATSALAYRRSLPHRPQRPERSYADRIEAFAGPVPERGAAGPDVIADLVARAEPGLHACAGPRFFGWVIGASHPVGVAADWLTSAWAQNAGNHHAMPSAAAAEAVAGQWIVDLLGLPPESSVGFATGATVANFIGLAAARAELLRRVGWDIQADGLFGAPEIRVLIGEEAHATLFGALKLLGFGDRQIIRIPADDQGRIEVAAFEREVARLEGPAIAVLQAGQMICGAFDRFAELIPIARARDLWVHVDGAFGLWARACPETAPLAAGVDLADSWATDGHKWLQIPYDCGFAIVRDAEAHRRAMTVTASYLPPVSLGERDPTHLVPELSRRARGFPVWAVIRALGREGIADMVARHCRIARRMAARLAAEPGVAVLNHVALNMVAVRFGIGEPPERGDDLTDRTIVRIQEDGTCFAGGADWKGRRILRLSVISWETTEADGDRSVDAILAAWRAVQAEASPAPVQGR